MSDDTVQRDLGRLEGKVDAMKDQHERMGSQLEAQGAKLDRVLQYIENEKGAKRTWKTIAGIGSAVAGALGGAVASWVLGGKP